MQIRFVPTLFLRFHSLFTSSGKYWVCSMVGELFLCLSLPFGLPDFSRIFDRIGFQATPLRGYLNTIKEIAPLYTSASLVNYPRCCFCSPCSFWLHSLQDSSKIRLSSSRRFTG